MCHGPLGHTRKKMLKRFDSLLARLLFTQLALLFIALFTISALVIAERNRVLAEQTTFFVGPALVAATRNLPRAQWPSEADSLDLERHERLPPGFKLNVTRMPAAQIFIEELARFGLTVDETRVSRRNGLIVMWAHARWRDSPPIWLSGYVLGLETQVPTRLLAAMALLLVVNGAIVWRFASRVTRPLAQLRLRMQAHALAGIHPGDAPPPMEEAGKYPRELVAIDKAYRQLADRLQRNERERALLLAGVSHDLRSPLSRIRLAAEMLRESPENQAGVSSITRNVDQADQLTESFLEFIRTGTVALNQRVNLADAARLVGVQFALTDPLLRVRAPDSLWLGGAHALLVERLIFNLVDNALKHGGTPVEVSVTQQDEMATICVSDAGPGLPEKDAGRMLEAFSRGDVSRGLPGFGLGLAISQQIVVRLRGELVFGQERDRHQVQARFPLNR